MKRFFLISLLLCLFASAAAAQITTVSGQVLDTNSIPYAGAQMKAQLVYTTGSPVTGQPTVTINNQAQCTSARMGTAPCQIPFQGTVGPFALSPTGTYTVNLQDNTQVTPASTQWLITVSSPGLNPPVGTGPQTFTAQQTISGSTQTLNLSGPALSNTSAFSTVTSNPATCNTGQAFYNSTTGQLLLCIATNTLQTQGGSWATVTDAKLYGVKADTKWCNSATFTLSSATVTTPAGCPAFVSTDSGSGTSGKIAWGSNAPVAGPNWTSPTMVMTKTNILTYNSAHSVTTNQTASQSLGPTNNDGSTFVWGGQGGVDDTAAYNSAYAADINACWSTLLIPAGWGMISSAIQTNNFNCPWGSAGNDGSFSQEVMGVGALTSGLVFTPNFTCTPYTLGACLFDAAQSGTSVTNQRRFHDFGLVSFSPPPSGMNGLVAIIAAFNSAVYNMWCLDWFSGLAYNAYPYSVSAGNGAITTFHDNFLNNCGAVGLTTANGEVFVHHNWIQGNNLYAVAFNAGATYSHHNIYGGGTTNQPVMYTNSASATVVSEDDTCAPQGSPSTCFGTQSGASIYVSNFFAQGGGSSGSVNCVSGAFCVLDGSVNSLVAGSSSFPVLVNAGTLKLRNTRFLTGNVAVNNSGQLNDYGGNNYNGISNTNTGTWIGEANSANITPLTTAKLVLSAGWGSTAAVSAPSGGDFPIQFTVTNSGTGQGASPTITYTFQTPLPVAPFTCTALQTGGTNSTGTFTSSALSATGVTFTFSLTPTASSTEIVQVTCVTP